MAMVTLAQAQRDLGALIRKVQEGETIVIVEADKPVAELHPVSQNGPTGCRPFGLAAGQFTVPDDFDDPLPEDILRSFEGR